MKNQCETMRIKSRSTMIVMNWSNKNLSRFLLSTKFRSVYESNLKRQFQYFLASFFTPCLLINEEIIRLKKEEKISNYYKKRIYNSAGEKFLIFKSKNKTTLVARPIARAACLHETEIWLL